MLVDYFEQTSEEMRNLEKKLIELDRNYRMFLDRDTREQMNLVKKDMKAALSRLVDYAYAHMQEFFLLKKHFPDFFNVIKEDPHLSKAIARLEWLLDFKKLDASECQIELNKIKSQRSQLREARDFMKKWVGRIDKESVIATWPVLKEHVTKELDRDEVLLLIRKKNRELRKNGWLVFLNDGLMPRALKLFLGKLKYLKEKEFEAKMELQKKKGKSIYEQSGAEKNFKAMEKKRRRIEKRCEHFLLVNYDYLARLKKQKSKPAMSGTGDRAADALLDGIVQRLSPAIVDEKKWVAEMKSKLG